MLDLIVKYFSDGQEIDMLHTTRLTITRMPAGTRFHIQDIVEALFTHFPQAAEHTQSDGRRTIEDQVRRFTREYAHPVTHAWYLCDPDASEADLFVRNERERFASMYTVEEELAFVFTERMQEVSDQHMWNAPMASAGEIVRAIQEGHFQGTQHWPPLVNGFSGNASFYGHLGLLDDSVALLMSERTSRHFRETGPTAIEILTERVQVGETPETSPTLKQLVEALSRYAVSV